MERAAAAISDIHANVCSNPGREDRPAFCTVERFGPGNPEGAEE